jgi:hypothetical protein
MEWVKARTKGTESMAPRAMNRGMKLRRRALRKFRNSSIGLFYG